MPGTLAHAVAARHTAVFSAETEGTRGTKREETKADTDNIYQRRKKKKKYKKTRAGFFFPAPLLLLLFRRRRHRYLIPLFFCVSLLKAGEPLTGPIHNRD